MGLLAVNGVGDIAKSVTDSSFSLEPELSKYRALVPVATNPNNIYLNASFQPPTNARVKAAVDEFFNQASNHAHPKPIWQSTTVQAKQLLAEYLHVAPETLAFTRDTTEGLNLFQRSIRWNKGDNVVVLDTEHPNHVYGWLALAEQGLEVRQIPAGEKGYANASTFALYVDDRTIAILSESLAADLAQWSR